MRKVCSLFAVIILAITARPQAKIGQPIGDIVVKTILNSPVKSVALSQLKGKVILLEFWATWCSPCVDAMPHLQELQKAFEDKLQIVTISTETEKRIEQFIENRASNLWFVVDTADAFRVAFPYHTIPHAVLINEQGVVVAITEPKNITGKVIDSVIQGKSVHLPLKEDNMNEDPWTTYFSVESTTQSRFSVQPKIDGLGSGYKSYPTDSNFKNRRLSMLNIPLESAYRIAYGGLPYGRTIDLTPKENILANKKMYCIDIVVPRGREKELLPTLQKELKARFDLQAGVEKRMRHVYILAIADSSKITKLKRSDATQETFAASHGTFEGEGIFLRKIADYLEGFGLMDLPVVDETGDRNKYDITFTFMPEKKGDLEDALRNLGLKLIKAEREIDMLVFR
jgi:uncharacterized protein (TIGR03435 family)